MEEEGDAQSWLPVCATLKPSPLHGFLPLCLIVHLRPKHRSKNTLCLPPDWPLESSDVQQHVRRNNTTPRVITSLCMNRKSRKPSDSFTFLSFVSECLHEGRCYLHRMDPDAFHSVRTPASGSRWLIWRGSTGFFGQLPSADVKVTISFMHNEMFAAVIVESALQPYRTLCTVTMRDSWKLSCWQMKEAQKYAGNAVQRHGSKQYRVRA